MARDSVRAWWSLAFVIVGPTIAAYLMNAWALKYAESSVVAAYTYLQPVFAVILAAIFLQEADPADRVTCRSDDRGRRVHLGGRTRSRGRETV